MAAVLCCGDGAVLSHGSAAALLGFGSEDRREVEVSVRSASPRRHPGIRVHRRADLRGRTRSDSASGIPVTSPAQTLVDLAARHDRMTVERMVDEADRLDLIAPPQLRGRARAPPRASRVWRACATMLDRRTFRLTRSRLERLFLPMASEVGLPVPETKVWVNGFEVDFHWPDLRPGGRDRRPAPPPHPGEQARDHLRDQAHAAAGFTSLRFTHEQVRYEPEHVRAVLGDVGAAPRGRRSVRRRRISFC